MNVTIGIPIKVDPKRFKLKHDIDGCFQSACNAAVCRTFAKHLGKQTRRSPIKLKLCENPKNIYFPKHTLRLSLPLGVTVSFIFLQGYRKF